MIRRPLQKVLAIGLDSCDLEYLRCYLPHLPTLQTLLGKGTLTEVDTTATAIGCPRMAHLHDGLLTR